jgi:intracellular sulfur oxidation DsrE/DsrF family protein
MSANRLESSIARRLFLARLGAGAGVLGAAAAGSSAAMAQGSSSAPWKPARHAQDDWLDKIPGQHRLVFDTTTPDGMSSALQFAGNYFTANHDAYALDDRDLAVVIVARHFSTSLAFNNAMWTKYGKQFAELPDLAGLKTNEPPTVNAYAARMDALIKRGVQFAVCQISSRRIAGAVAKSTGGDAGGILKELSANLVANAHLVSAGIVAVNRAQERGYSFVSAV